MKTVYSIFETARVRVSIGWLLVSPTQFVGVSKSTAKCIWMREVSLIRIFEIPLERPYAGALALHLCLPTDVPARYNIVARQRRGIPLIRIFNWRAAPQTRHRRRYGVVLLREKAVAAIFEVVCHVVRCCTLSLPLPTWCRPVVVTVNKVGTVIIYMLHRRQCCCTTHGFVRVVADDSIDVGGTITASLDSGQILRPRTVSSSIKGTTLLRVGEARRAPSTASTCRFDIGVDTFHFRVTRSSRITDTLYAVAPHRIICPHVGSKALQPQHVQLRCGSSCHFWRLRVQHMSAAVHTGIRS
mmetsp:Transcript_84828/g.124136  ORF Transcript_84828/g.124136 Transcript_84828/m.124136 type:complete len:299 (-) Transcript_84828:302-1198(-)